MSTKHLLAVVMALTCALLSSMAPVAAHTLKENFSVAERGDYVVAYASKSYTLLHIVDKVGDTLTIEEVTVPERYRPSGSSSWKGWMAQGAPRNTSWVIYDIDLHGGKVLRFYSFTKKGWADMSTSDNLLGTLLQLPIRKVSDRDRKRIGPRPGPGDLDRRAIWQPPAFFDGRRIDGVAFDAWRTSWPPDGSELAGKTVDIYLADSDQGQCLPYFPYWLEVRATAGKAKLRIKDSGRGLFSPKGSFPR